MDQIKKIYIFYFINFFSWVLGAASRWWLRPPGAARRGKNPGHNIDLQVYMYPWYVTHRHEMSLKGDFCDSFSTTLSVTSHKVALESMCQRRQSPNKDFDQICISTGVICIWSIWPLYSFVLSLFCISRSCVRLDLRFATIWDVGGLSHTTFKIVGSKCQKQLAKYS
jgi:hypothetical protein